MKKLCLGVALALAALLAPSRGHAVPLDVPYQMLVSTVGSMGQVRLSTTTFASAVPAVNQNVNSYQWCISHVSVSAPAAPTNFTMFWSTAVFAVGTTDYMVVTSTGQPYDVMWPYRNPYCSPVGMPVLTLQSSVVTSTITVEGYLYKGMNP